jgi:PAS domain-containing protein
MFRIATRFARSCAARAALCRRALFASRRGGVYSDRVHQSPVRPRGTSGGPLKHEDSAYEEAAGLAIDLSERKRLEDDLRSSERQLSSIYLTVDDAIFELAVEPDGHYVFESVNPAFSRITGIPVEAVVGKRVDEVIPGLCAG